MKASVIVICGNMLSTKGFNTLIESSMIVDNEFDIKLFQAVVPDEVEDLMRKYKLRWTWPWKEEEIDLQLMLKKNPYQTKEPLKRIATFLSHYLLWKKTAEGTESRLILEHDAKFIRKIKPEELLKDLPANGILGLNDPRGATRKSQVFYDKVMAGADGIQPAPMVEEDMMIPQGLAGNSAYIITPDAARAMVRASSELGAWPNDALMCMQVYPYLFVTKPFYTRVQGLPSTTTL